MEKRLRIAINAQILGGSGTGGIETVLRVMTSLGRLDGDEEYVFIGHWSGADWLKPLLGERQTIVYHPGPDRSIGKPGRIEALKRLSGPLRPFARGIKRLFVPPEAFLSQPVSSPPLSTGDQIGVPVSDGFYESLNCNVIHFPYQDYVFCPGVPTVYNPHDLQHLHYPQFFPAEEIERREIIYPAACRAAQTIVVASQFIKQDIVEKYKIAGDKIQIIPWSPPEPALSEFTDKDARILFEKYECPPRPFILYPAMTWEHKNHIRLLEAVALLRDSKNLEINVVCTGHKNSFYPSIERKLHELNLEKQIRFTGVVEYAELSLFYRQAQFVIIPTLFEAASAPLFEAWQHGAAVACSSVTSLPEQASGAACFFNPLSIEEIADVIVKMMFDEELRGELRARGFRRLQDFELERTAKAYRAVYRRTAGFRLSEEDQHLLKWDWMHDSQPGFPENG